MSILLVIVYSKRLRKEMIGLRSQKATRIKDTISNLIIHAYLEADCGLRLAE